MQMVALSTCVLRVDLVSTGTVMMLAVRKCGLIEYRCMWMGILRVDLLSIGT
jgi:hypothetical protein